MSLAAFASEIKKAIICEFEMNVKKYFYWRFNISYHSNDTPLHYEEKFMSFSKYNSFSLSCRDFPAAALVIKITKAADVWGRKDGDDPWNLIQGCHIWTDWKRIYITHISLSKFGQIFAQTFFLSLNILVQQTLPLPPTPIFSKALLYWRLNIPESIWKRLSVSAFMKY